MNSNSNKPSLFNMKSIFGIFVFIACIIGLYYAYNALYGSNGAQGSVNILSGNVQTTKTTKDTASGMDALSAVDLSGIHDGGEYSVSFWTYISDTKGFNTGSGGVGAKLAHLMEISDNRFSSTQKGNTLVFVGLNPINGSLVVRQSTLDGSDQINNSTAVASITSDLYPLSSLINEYNTGSKFTKDDKCDILNGIEYQRWVLVTVVGNGKTLDVYVDGKLARSCVYKSQFALSSSSGKGTAYFGLDNGGKLKGYMSNGNFYNYALTPDAVWSIYQAGPSSGSNGFLDFFKNLFSVNVTFATNVA